ncbi:hypothetical protein PsYK624_052720 [Phanerochaete sordida]|uniref:Uncharacterized protein n=1 Tax=Phanerochaete sordida TaxID=48140 RepID=A0A9P3G6X8_9APHY|nr:hypothetical protein PsYK624_052720 [Phanerochaete sordida]
MKPQDKSRVQCYKCKRFGHYPADSVCLLYEKPTLHRMDMDVADPTVELALLSPETKQPASLMVMHAEEHYRDVDEANGVNGFFGAGSQYESDDFYGCASNFDNTTPASDDKNDIARVYAIRVVDEDIPALIPLTREAVAMLPSTLCVPNANGGLDDLSSLQMVLDSVKEFSDLPSLRAVSDSDEGSVRSTDHSDTEWSEDEGDAATAHLTGDLSEQEHCDDPRNLR